MSKTTDGMMVTAQEAAGTADLRFSQFAMGSVVDLALFMAGQLRNAQAWRNPYVDKSDVDIWRMLSMRQRDHYTWTAIYFLEWWDKRGRYLVPRIEGDVARVERVARALYAASVLFYLKRDGGCIGWGELADWSNKSPFMRWHTMSYGHRAALLKGAAALLVDMGWLPKDAPTEGQA